MDIAYTGIRIIIINKKIPNQKDWKGPLEVLLKARLSSKLDWTTEGFVQLCFEIIQGQRFHVLSRFLYSHMKL